MGDICELVRADCESFFLFLWCEVHVHFNRAKTKPGFSHISHVPDQTRPSNRPERFIEREKTRIIEKEKEK